MSIDWDEVLRVRRESPNTRWIVEGDEGFRCEGRITHWPPGPPSAWPDQQSIRVGDGEIGEAILIRLVRRIVKA